MAKGAVPGFDMQLVGIDQGAVDVENESAHMYKKDLRKSTKQVHVFELDRLSVMKCADSHRRFHFECCSLLRRFIQ
jgi:hypothetical protein